jgi:hypothetical protein
MRGFSDSASRAAPGNGDRRPACRRLGDNRATRQTPHDPAALGPYQDSPLPVGLGAYGRHGCGEGATRGGNESRRVPVRVEGQAWPQCVTSADAPHRQ